VGDAFTKDYSIPVKFSFAASYTLARQIENGAPADSKIVLKIEPHFAIAETLGTGRLATGDPDSVPVGRYAREALTKLGAYCDPSMHELGVVFQWGGSRRRWIRVTRLGAGIHIRDGFGIQWVGR
jgi:ABC-type molybdate transport system substrate-binding protein